MTAADVLRLDSQMCFQLYGASRAMMQLYQPLLEQLGLTYPQYLVMLALWEQDGLSVRAIGERLFLDSGTLTPLLKRLEKGGLVRRTRSTEDERVVLVTLTPEGKARKRKAQGVPVALFCKVGLQPDEFTRLRGELGDLFARLRALTVRDT